jgi:hypothetical protein
MSILNIEKERNQFIASIEPYAQCYLDASPLLNALFETTIKLNELLALNQSQDALILAETAIDAVHYILPKISLSTEFDEAFKSLPYFHLRASKAVKPNPIKLAQKILHWQVYGYGDMFYNSVNEYCDVLGDEGLLFYANAAASGWMALNYLCNNENDPDIRIYRTMLLRVALTAAELVSKKDVAESIFAHKLQRPNEYFEIAVHYENQGNNSAALIWAEKGMQAFCNEPQWQLCAAAFRACDRLGEQTKGIDIIWHHFAMFPCQEGLDLLELHSKNDDSWPYWFRFANSILKIYKYSQTTRTENVSPIL